jgi:hypothetical protein
MWHRIDEEKDNRHVHLDLSTRLISHGTVFFFHNKMTSVGLSAAETISQTG